MLDEIYYLYASLCEMHERLCISYHIRNASYYPPSSFHRALLQTLCISAVAQASSGDNHCNIENISFLPHF